MSNETGQDQPTAAAPRMAGGIERRWLLVKKRGWSRDEFPKVLEKWLRAGINLAYRQEFAQFLRRKYNFDFTGADHGPEVSRATLHRTKKSKTKRPLGWEIIAPAMAMADAVFTDGEIRSGRMMAAVGLGNTLAKVRAELTSRGCNCDLAVIVSLWEMSKPYWEESINAEYNTDYERERSALRLRIAVEKRTGVRLNKTFADLERLRQQWWTTWILLQETIEDEWVWKCLTTIH